MPLSQISVDSQLESLKVLARLSAKDFADPLVRQVARQITQDLPSRDDMGELKAIYKAVKRGDPRVRLCNPNGLCTFPLAKGLRYVNDPKAFDHFVAPNRLIRDCAEGACAEDCDGHAALIAALLGALGWLPGLRVWGPGQAGAPYEHVYAVVAYPKNPPYQNTIALDTTTPDDAFNWQPSGPNFITAWLGPDGDVDKSRVLAVAGYRDPYIQRARQIAARATAPGWRRR